jgi:hypothetical protein
MVNNDGSIHLGTWHTELWKLISFSNPGFRQQNKIRDDLKFTPNKTHKVLKVTSNTIREIRRVASNKTREVLKVTSNTTRELRRVTSNKIHEVLKVTLKEA